MPCAYTHSCVLLTTYLCMYSTVLTYELSSHLGARWARLGMEVTFLCRIVLAHVPVLYRLDKLVAEKPIATSPTYVGINYM